MRTTMYSPQAEGMDYFGWALATNGETLAIGAPFDDDGKVFLYDRP